MKNYESTTTIHGDMFIPLLADGYNVGDGANNSDFVALSDTIRILEGARNSVLPATPPILSAIPNRRQHRVWLEYQT